MQFQKIVLSLQLKKLSLTNKIKIMNIALVAHDGRKKELLEWVRYNAEKLFKHRLFATGTTGKLIIMIIK